MFDPETLERIRAELHRAEQARASHNEGQARVMARRAAGTAIRAYLHAKGMHSVSANAYDLLVWLTSYEQVPGDMREAANRLTVRVNEDYQLPIEADLIADARWLAERLAEIS